MHAMRVLSLLSSVIACTLCHITTGDDNAAAVAVVVAAADADAAADAENWVSQCVHVNMLQL